MSRETTEINMDNITTGDCIELFECKNTRVIINDGNVIAAIIPTIPKVIRTSAKVKPNPNFIPIYTIIIV